MTEFLESLLSTPQYEEGEYSYDEELYEETYEELDFN